MFMLLEFSLGRFAVLNEEVDSPNLRTIFNFEVVHKSSEVTWETQRVHVKLRPIIWFCDAMQLHHHTLSKAKDVLGMR